MRTIYKGKSLWFGAMFTTFTSGLLTLGLMSSAVAQIASDGTTNTTVNINGNDLTILNGLSKGNNLFHSFSSFSVNTGQTATFDLKSTPDITTIFGRVTGNTVSNIDGLIRTLNSNNPVSLFLMNPHGIVFGPHASLNIGGSFVGTTSESILFQDNFEFSATNPSVSPLLTMSAPIGLQFGQSPGKIAIQGTDDVKANLRLLNKQGMLLAGNAVTIENALIRLPGGRLDVASVAGAGVVELTPNGKTFQLNVPGTMTRGDFFTRDALDGGSLIDLSSAQGGSVAITAQNFYLKNTYIRGGVNAFGGSVNTISGSFTFDIRDTMQLDAGVVTTRISDGRFGYAGDINIKTGSLLMGNANQITASISGTGQAGNIIINAREKVILDGYGTGDVQDYNTMLSSSVRSTAQGNAGTITINAPLISVGNGSLIVGPAQGNGNGANINLNTRTLKLVNGGQIYTTTTTAGNAGAINVNATEQVIITGTDSTYNQRDSEVSFNINQHSGLFVNTTPSSSGASGNINIRTSNLVVSDGGQISASASGTGNAGNIGINAGTVQLKNAANITSESRAGEQGNIQINADLLIMRRESRISTNATEKATGGHITIDAPIILGLENSDISANAVQGSGGDIQITTQGILGLKYRDQLTSENDITASSEFGVSGTVQVNTIGVDPNSGLIELPANVTDPSQQIATGCSANTGSSFVVTGRGGIPQNPTQEVISFFPWSDVRDISMYRQTVPVQAQIPESPDVLVQATGWRRNVQGKVEIFADKSGTQVQQPLTCAAVTQSEVVRQN